MLPPVSRRTLALGGGGLATALALAFWLGRRSGKRSSLSGDGTGISALDYALQMPKLHVRAAAQVARAAAGDWLTDYRKAENLSSFFSAPAYDVQAYYAAGYWMGVAARLLHSRSLAARASATLAQGAALYLVPLSSLKTGSVVEIMADARSVIEDASGSNKAAKPVIAALKSSGSPGMVENAQKGASERGWLYQGTKKTAADVTPKLPSLADGYGIGDYVRALFGLDDPRTGKPYPLLMRLGMRAGVGTVAVGGVYLFLRRPGGGTTVVVQAPPPQQAAS